MISSDKLSSSRRPPHPATDLSLQNSFGRLSESESLVEMFTNHKRQAERAGRSGTPRAQYLQVICAPFSLIYLLASLLPWARHGSSSMMPTELCYLAYYRRLCQSSRRQQMKVISLLLQVSLSICVAPQSRDQDIYLSKYVGIDWNS